MGTGDTHWGLRTLTRLGTHTGDWGYTLGWGLGTHSTGDTHWELGTHTLLETHLAGDTHTKLSALPGTVFILSVINVKTLNLIFLPKLVTILH